MSALAAKPDPRAAEATRQLFEKHRRRIYGYCLGQLGNRCDAEDAVQTTFLYAFGCLERGVVPDAELAWLFKIALNVCRTRRRSAGRRRRVEAPVDFDAYEYALAAPERGDNELLELSSALAAMPANQRNAILLREWQGLTYAEIAERLTISQSAVETLLFRARRTLASQLDRVPQKVAVMLNVPVLFRLLRRLVSNAGAIKTTAAVVAVGAVSTVGGHELSRIGRPAPVQVHVQRHAPTNVTAASIYPRRVSTASASPGRNPRPVQTAAPSTAEAAVPTHAERSTPPAASAPNSTPPNASPAPTTPTVTPQIPAQIISPPAAPTLLVEPPVAAAGELAGSVVDTATAVVDAITGAIPVPVPHVNVPAPPKLLPSP
jgi:RNA polymerase sigma-70 factor (ECF subfamily)